MVFTETPRRAPGIQRICFYCSSFRAEELRLDGLLHEEDRTTRCDILDLPVTALHAVCAENNDSDIRHPDCFLLPILWQSLRVPVVVLEISDRNEAVTVHVSTPDNSKEAPITLVEHRGQLRWEKPTSQTTPEEWREWLGNVPTLRDRNANGGLGFLRHCEAIVGHELRPCRFLPKFSKVVNSDVGVSGNEPACLDSPPRDGYIGRVKYDAVGAIRAR